MKKSDKDLLLDPNSKVSSMRWALVTLIPVIKWMLISTPVILVLEVYFSDTASWTGAAAYVAALGVFLGALLGTKALQKSNETK